jgi:two-component sensor histidine kinase
MHHRVKNMVQMTSGLLLLQARGVRSSEAKVALREAQSRLLVLSNVYEALLEPNADRQSVDAASLIHRLLVALRDTSANGSKVEVRTDCDRLLLRVATAVPLGLIVNEALTNALKYAFEGSTGGQVVVRLKCTGDQCVLAVSDNGCGFSEPVRSGSLGVVLMRRLARQLGGHLTIDGSHGTTVELVWKLAADEVPPLSQA